MVDISKCLEKIQFNYLFGATITHTDKFETGTEISTCCKFYYVLDGEYELTIGQQSYEAKAGSMFFIPAGIPQSRRYIGNVRHVSQQYMHFNFLSLTEPNLFDRLSLPYKIDIGLRTDVKKMFNTVFRLASQTTLSARFKLTAIILNLFGLYVEKSGGGEEWPRNYRRNGTITGKHSYSENYQIHQGQHRQTNYKRRIGARRLHAGELLYTFFPKANGYHAAQIHHKNQNRHRHGAVGKHGYHDKPRDGKGRLLRHEPLFPHFQAAS